MGDCVKFEGVYSYSTTFSAPRGHVVAMRVGRDDIFCEEWESPVS